MIDLEKQARKERLLRHIQRLEVVLERLEALDQRFVQARGLTLLVGSLGAAWALFGPVGQAGPWVLGFFVLLFIIIIFYHRRVDRSRLRFRLAKESAEAQVARQDLNWPGIPAALAVIMPAEHPFAPDLSLTGERSLHQLLDTATSRGGSERLADWLLNPVPQREEIEQRQAILREMLPLTGLRSRLALKGRMVKEKAGGRWDSERLLHWLDKHTAVGSLVPLLALLFGLSFLSITLFVLNMLGLLPAWWMVSLTLYAGIYLYKFRDYASLLADSFEVGEALDQFRDILEYLEKYPYPAGGPTEQLCRPFWAREDRPSGYLKRIVWITSAASLGSNQFLALVFNALVPWNLLFAQIMNRYKKALRGSLLSWLDTWYELEALTSLANYAYLNPGTTFPEISERAGEFTFKSRSLGHPLLAEPVRVDNDFSLSSLGEVALITGSNMSGKSTFLRTLGINLCMAYAGGPVQAESMQTRLFRLFTCIQVSDSLSNGISYFYAEVRRLKALLQALEADEEAPLFFLIDEIFRGTNNRERRIGSQSYVRTLANSRGTGAISTHDLELAHLADEDPQILNYHFREEVIEGRMVFDYKLRGGPSPTTNALRIMELEGLPVEKEALLGKEG